MADAIIGALRVVLGADTAAFEDGLKRADSKLSSFGDSIAKGAAAIAAAVAAGAAALAVSVKHTIDQADELGKLSQKIGIPIEDLSRLKHAADLSGVGLEDLGKSVGKLSKTMSEVAGGATNLASKAFEALGISVKNSDGTLKSSTQVMSDVAGKFERIEDGAGKTALAMAIFGKSGANLIPLLNSGAAGLKAMGAEADQLGIIIDEKTAKSAEAFNDNLTRLGKVKDSIILKITAGLLPSLESLSVQMINTAKDSTALKEVSDLVNSSFKFITEEAIRLGAGIRSIGIEINGLVAAAKLIGSGEFKKAWETFSAAQDASVKNMEAASKFVATMWDKAAEENAAKAHDLSDKIAAPIIQSADKAVQAQKAIDAFLTAQLKQQAARAAEIASLDLTTGAHERLRIQMQANAIEEQFGITLKEQTRAKIEAVAAAAEQLANKLKGTQLVLSARTPNEQYQAEMEKNKQALVAFGATAEQIAAVQEQTAMRYSNTWGQAGESIAGSFAKISGSFSKESNSMATAAKAFGLVQATISMWTGAAKALELPWPANLAAWASVLAIGAGALANIRSQNIPALASGGSMQVPGGIGGGDTKLFQAMVEPGEMINVTPNRGRGGGGGDRTITVEGVDLMKWFDGRRVRELMGLFNEEIGNGARLRFV